MSSNEPGRVTIQEGVVVGTTGARDLRADVFIPPGDLKDAPGVLLIHGGGWMQGDRSQLRGYGVLLGRKGYVCVSCEYRLTGEAQWPAQIHDVKAALRWMRANASSLGLDPDRIAVSGNSAGGHLSLMVGATPNVPEFEGEGGNSGISTDVSAVISFYPPVRLGTMRDGAELSDPVRRLMGSNATPEAIAGASPITYASASFPPTALIHGSDDEIVSVAESFEMQKALAKAGVPTDLHIYAGQPHGFDATSALGRQCADVMALFLARYVAVRENAAV